MKPIQPLTLDTMPIPAQIQQEIVDILVENGGDSEYKRAHTLRLSELYLQYVEPHELANNGAFDYNHKRWYTCPKCVAKTWEYFTKRFQSEL